MFAVVTLTSKLRPSVKNLGLTLDSGLIVDKQLRGEDKILSAASSLQSGTLSELRRP